MPETRILALFDPSADTEAARAGGLAVLVRDGKPADRSADGSVPLRWIGTWDVGTRLAGDVAAGAVLILSTSPERLLSRYDFPALADFAQACRAAGASFGFAGGIEPPDVPRLLPLGPALIGIETGAAAAGGVEAMRALVASRAPAATAAPPHPVPDRVFIRDFVQEMELGAYRSEQGRRQRVRFGVEAELEPVSRARGMADIYSYDRMMDAVRALAHRAPEPFVETLAEDLAADILRDPRVQAVTVRVEKLDLGPDAAGVEIRRARA